MWLVPGIVYMSLSDCSTYIKSVVDWYVDIYFYVRLFSVSSSFLREIQQYELVCSYWNRHR